jgi:uncharacterized protein (DUF1015 family)
MTQEAPIIRPFAALRPTPDYAADVIAPPYDVLNTAEARALARDKPWSFLHISKPEIDLDEGISPYDDAVYTKGAENLRTMIDKGILKQDSKPCYYIYQIIMGDHTQTGIVAAGSITAYDANRIRRHEFTRPDKEDDRVKQIDILGAQTGPVMVTHRASNTLSQFVSGICSRSSDYSVTAHNGVIHTLWVVDAEGEIATISDTFEAMDAIYIADGHHRSAAASRVAASRKKGDDFLIVSFPDDEVQILDYNRVITDLNGLTKEDYLASIEAAFEVSPSTTASKPSAPGQFGMYLDNQWYSLKIRGNAPQNDPVASLDVSILSDRLLTPILNIGDPRVDKRIDFVGGIRGLEELERRVDSGEMAVAFSFFPTSLKDLMDVADAGEVMPPKSTWFEPKLADGMASLMLD